MLAAGVIFGTVALVGSGVYARWVGPTGPDGATHRLLVAGAIAGGVLVAFASIGDALHVVARFARGPLDAGLAVDYLSGTRHGRASAARAVLALALAAWALRPVRVRPGWGAGAAYAATALALLATVAATSHSGAASTAGLLADLGHLVATVSWAGSLAYLSVSPVWAGAHAPLAGAVARVGRLGLVSVGLMAVTGVGMSIAHLYGLDALTHTDYGVTLTMKLVVVAAVLSIAAVNRLAFVPWLERGQVRGPLRTAVRFEALLLVLVLAVTAVLTTTAPAAPPLGAP